MTITGLLLSGLALYVGYKVLRLIIDVFVDQSDRRLRKNAPQILDNTFNGSENAIYRVREHGTLAFDQVLLGAEQRGYSIYDRSQDSASQTTLVFKKDSAPSF